MYHFEKFVDYVSGLLRIVPPYTVFVSSEEMIERNGPDSFAEFDANANTIYLEQRDEYEMMDYYRLAVFLRGIWQTMTGFEYSVKGYPASSKISTYEIDARAFACVAIAIRFEKVARQTFKSNPLAQELLEKRTDELAEEYGIDIYLIG